MIDRAKQIKDAGWKMATGAAVGAGARMLKATPKSSPITTSSTLPKTPTNVSRATFSNADRKLALDGRAVVEQKQKTYMANAKESIRKDREQLRNRQLR